MADVWLRVVLGALFAGMAVGQALSWSQMTAILTAYQVTAGAGSTVLAGALLGAQVVVAVWFLAFPRSSALLPVSLYAAVALTWTVLGLQAIVRGIPVDNCGCFGSYLSQPLSWFTLAQDGLLLVYAVVLVRLARRGRRRPADRSGSPGRAQSTSPGGHP